MFWKVSFFYNHKIDSKGFLGHAVSSNNKCLLLWLQIFYWLVWRVFQVFIYVAQTISNANQQYYHNMYHFVVDTCWNSFSQQGTLNLSLSCYLVHGLLKWLGENAPQVVPSPRTTCPTSPSASSSSPSSSAITTWPKIVILPEMRCHIQQPLLRIQKARPFLNWY